MALVTGVQTCALPIYRKQLLAYDVRHRMQPGAGPAGENYALQHRGGVSWALVRTISGTASARDARQDLAWMPKTRRTFRQSRTELAGRRAAVGQAEAGIGRTDRKSVV